MNEEWTAWASRVEHRLDELDHVRAWFIEDEDGSTDLHEVLGLVVAQLRGQVFEAINQTRADLNLPSVRPKIRVPCRSERL
jgi:hypothetical protein